MTAKKGPVLSISLQFIRVILQVTPEFNPGAIAAEKNRQGGAP